MRWLYHRIVSRITGRSEGGSLLLVGHLKGVTVQCLNSSVLSLSGK